jgi:hypothetical protein
MSTWKGSREPLAPHEEFGERAKAIDLMDASELRAEARKWLFSAIRAADDSYHSLMGAEAVIRDLRHQLARVHALIPRNGKTVKVDDLLGVLMNRDRGLETPCVNRCGVFADRADSMAAHLAECTAGAEPALSARNEGTEIPDVS